jgi:thiosulfate dehydrogenase
MKAILLYYKWLGRGRPNLENDPNDRLVSLAFLKRAANPELGKDVYLKNCKSCHGDQGQGRLRPDEKAFLYPPLWGDESFSSGASFSRLGILARFLKANMPYGATFDHPKLSDEESWDVGAYVLTKQRPAWRGKTAFPVLSEKPYDFPFGPYADSFSEQQHRLGPFQPILDYWVSKQGARAGFPSTGM